MVVAVTSASSTTTSAVDGLGDRVASAAGGTFGFLVSDLHGNVAGALDASASSFTDAFAYDAYGDTVASLTSSLPTPWRYQGRMLESGAGAPALYDFAARSYAPSLGIFTSLDTLGGSATKAALLNGYLYADANPATLVDPDGHSAAIMYDEGGAPGTLRAAPRGAVAASWASASRHDMSSSVYNEQHLADSWAAASATDMSSSVYASREAAWASANGGDQMSDSVTKAKEQQALADSWAAESHSDMGNAAWVASHNAWAPGMTNDASARNIAAENEYDSYNAECMSGDQAACATMSTINVNYGDPVGAAVDATEHVVGGTEDVLDVHTVGWCGTAGGYIGVPWAHELGVGGSVQVCVMITGKGQIGLSVSGGGGVATSVGKNGLSYGTGPMFSSGQYIEDQNGPFDAASTTMGPVEVDSEWGPSSCKATSEKVSTQYVGWSTPGLSFWQGRSKTYTLPLSSSPEC